MGHLVILARAIWLFMLHSEEYKIYLRIFNFSFFFFFVLASENSFAILLPPPSSISKKTQYQHLPSYTSSKQPNAQLPLPLPHITQKTQPNPTQPVPPSAPKKCHPPPTDPPISTSPKTTTLTGSSTGSAPNAASATTQRIPRRAPAAVMFAVARVGDILLRGRRGSWRLCEGWWLVVGYR